MVADESGMAECGDDAVGRWTGHELSVPTEKEKELSTRLPFAFPDSQVVDLHGLRCCRRRS